MRKTGILAGVVVALTSASAALAAPSNGDTVTCISNIFDCSASSATVGSGTEFTLDPGNGPVLSADFSTGLLTVTNIYNNSVGFGGRLVFKDTTSPFTTATVTGVNNVLYFDQTNVAIASNGALSINFGQYTGSTLNPSFFAQPGASISIQLGTIPAAVPELSAWAMMIFGVGAIGFAMRRRNIATKVKFA